MRRAYVWSLRPQLWTAEIGVSTASRSGAEVSARLRDEDVEQEDLFRTHAEAIAWADRKVRA